MAHYFTFQALLALRPKQLGSDILSSAQAIFLVLMPFMILTSIMIILDLISIVPYILFHFTCLLCQSILAEGDICASQRRAASEGLGLLARLGNDIFTVD